LPPRLPLSASRTLSPYTPLFRSRGYFSYSRLLYRWSFRQWHWAVAKDGKKAVKDVKEPRPYAVPTTFEPGARNKDLGLFDVIYVDRKSTRLNSSHVSISYAVFCL